MVSSTGNELAVKDFNGARTVRFEVKGDSIFMWGYGFCYEFDVGIFDHAMMRLLHAEDPAEAGPTWGSETDAEAV